MKPYGPGAFCFGRLLFVSFIDTGLFRLSFFLREFWQIVPFEDLVHFISVMKLGGIELFIAFLYCPLNVHEF